MNYLMLSVGLFIALRLVDAAQLLGHVFVR